MEYFANNDKKYKIFSKNLKHYIELSGKSQSEICEELNIKLSTFNMWVLGNSFPRFDKLQQLAEYFNISITDLTETKIDYDISPEEIEDFRVDQDIKCFIENYKNLQQHQKELILKLLKELNNKSQ